MTDFDNNTDRGELSGGELFGFDEPQNDEPQSGGYTVTPDGGYFEEDKAFGTDNVTADETFSNVGYTENSEPEPQPQPTVERKPDYGYASDYNKYFSANPKHNNAFKKAGNKKYGIGVVITSIILAAVIGAVASSLVLMRFGGFENSESDVVLPQNNSTTTINVEKTASNIVEAVAEKVTPSVVGIRTTSSYNNFFYGSTESTGEGSGIIYTSDGYIITNYHVIGDAVESSSGKIEVFLSSDTTGGIAASVIGYNISTDLAVIKINKKGLPAVEIGTSDSLKVGQFVVAIGNPGGLEYMSSVTYGVVSGLNRSVSSESGKNKSKINYIQTDAAINPGNSGGALVDSQGRLIGVNSVKIVSESYEGMGFAIPVNSVVEICRKIIERKDAPAPYIGVNLSERYDADTLRYLGYPAGAVVQSVIGQSPAEKSNIKRGDIITEFAGEEIEDYEDFNDVLSECEVGQKVKIKIYRGGGYYSTNIVVGSDNSAK